MSFNELAADIERLPGEDIVELLRAPLPHENKENLPPPQASDEQGLTRHFFSHQEVLLLSHVERAIDIGFNCLEQPGLSAAEKCAFSAFIGSFEALIIGLSNINRDRRVRWSQAQIHSASMACTHCVHCPVHGPNHPEGASCAQFEEPAPAPEELSEHIAWSEGVFEL